MFWVLFAMHQVGESVEHLKPNKNWFVGVFKCLDYDQMAGSRICMSKDKSNQLTTFGSQSEGCIWVGRIRTQILLEGHKSLSVCVWERKMYLSLRDALSWRQHGWILTTDPSDNFTMVVVFCDNSDQVAAFFCEDCYHDRSVFVRTATMIAMLIRLRISETF